MKFVRTLLLAGAVVGLASLAPTPVRAETYDSDDSDHPFRYAAYGVHAVGKVVENFVTRPVHWFVSRPKMRYIFGKSSQPRKEEYNHDPDVYQKSSY